MDKLEEKCLLTEEEILGARLRGEEYAVTTNRKIAKENYEITKAQLQKAIPIILKEIKKDLEDNFLCRGSNLLTANIKQPHWQEYWKSKGVEG